MKAIRIVALGLALMAGSTAAYAQGGGGGAGGRGGRGGNAMVGIDLTAEQQAKMAEITAKYAAENTAIGELMQTDRPAAMKKRAEVRAKMLPEQRAILTPEQASVFDKNQAMMKARADSMAKAMPPAI